VLLGCLIAAVPLGLLAEGDAWGEWGLQDITEQVGYTPSGMANGLDFTAWMPDYSIAGLPEWLGYLLSAVAGIAILLILFKLIGLLVQRKKAA
jgi:cobalt/nickel transport system permease protein